MIRTRTFKPRAGRYIAGVNPASMSITLHELFDIIERFYCQLIDHVTYWKRDLHWSNFSQIFIHNIEAEWGRLGRQSHANVVSERLRYNW